jgi:ABC-type multidrug transport system ATPase subunit
VLDDVDFDARTGTVTGFLVPNDCTVTLQTAT